MEIIFLLDTSNSMMGERINQLNHAMLDVLSSIDYVAKKDNETVNVRVITFNTVAKFAVGNVNGGIPVFCACDTWQNLTVKGTTDTAHAVRLCKNSMEYDYSNSNFNKTIVMLVTDGQCDDENDFDEAISELRNSISNMKEKSICFAAVGVCDYDKNELEKFAGLNKNTGLSVIYTIDDVSRLNIIIENALKF